jgi:hypothetical protein
MAEIIDLKTFTDNRGNLTVIEKCLPFDMKRIFYIYGVDDSERGHHRHKETLQAAICLVGSCKIWVDEENSKGGTEYVLDVPSKCLLLNPEDWHKMYDFTSNAILMVVASTEFNPDDYIFER